MVAQAYGNANSVDAGSCELVYMVLSEPCLPSEMLLLTFCTRHRLEHVPVSIKLLVDRVGISLRECTLCGRKSAIYRIIFDQSGTDNSLAIHCEQSEHD